MELMKVILHSDAIERSEKLYYPDLVRKGRLDSSDEIRQTYFEYLTKIKDSIIDLQVDNNNLELTFRTQGVGVVKGISTQMIYVLPLPEELIQEIIYDPRIGFGFCTQCQREFPIATGCTQATNIYGKCNPKNFIPFIDKEGKKVFKGRIHYKDFLEWNPDEYIPHSPEKMKKNREFARNYNAKKDEENSSIKFRYKEF